MATTKEILIHGQLTQVTEFSNTAQEIDDAVDKVQGYGLGVVVATIETNGMANLIFGTSYCSAIVNCRGGAGAAYATFLYTGYGRGGVNRSNVKRLTGDPAVLYGILPEDNGTGMSIWNALGNTALTVSVLVLQGKLPAVNTDDLGATAEPYEWDNPPMALGVEYRTTERYLGKPVYKQLVNCGYTPDTAQTTVTLEDTTIRIFEVTGRTTDGNTIPIQRDTAKLMTIHGSGNNIVITNNASSYSKQVAYAKISYTKTTD